MNTALNNRSLVSWDSVTAPDVQLLLAMAQELKRARAGGSERTQLRGKNIALLSDQSAVPNPATLQTAAAEQGAYVSRITPADPQRLQTRSWPDTARLLGRLYDAIEYRGLEPATVQALTRWSGVPVYSGLSQPFHPTQILADFLTMQEHCAKPLSQIRLAYIGDARSMTLGTLLQGAALMGIDLRIAGPRALWPKPQQFKRWCDTASAHGAQLRLTESRDIATQGADFVYCHMGNARPTRGKPATGDKAALHLTQPSLGKPASLAADQAENQLHTIKALLVATLA
jgi:ornithine carbamoyltransferase